jgi:hypothetical protein
MSWIVVADRTRSTTRKGRTIARALSLAAAWLLTVAASSAGASTLHFEIAYATGVNQFTSYNYVCMDCSIEQYENLALPAGYAIRYTRLLLPVTAGGFPATPPAGVPVGLDLVPELPGDDFFFCCEVLGGSFLGLDAGVLFTTAVVKRSNVFTYAAGDVLHELIDTLGNRYALFLIDLALADTHDVDELDSLADLPLPPGWSYESHVLNAPLEVGTNGGVADNFGQVALGSGVLTAWQLYAVPEPGTVLLVAAGLVGLGVTGRKPRNA